MLLVIIMCAVLQQTPSLRYKYGYNSCITLYPITRITTLQDFFNVISCLSRRQASSDHLSIRLQAGQPGNRGSIPDMGKNLSLLGPTQPIWGVQALRLRHEADHSSEPSPKVMNVCGDISPLPEYNFNVGCLIWFMKHEKHKTGSSVS